jgi:peptidoglycan/xylan/chitin deacetylase (PgdA/CDA1 family)
MPAGPVKALARLGLAIAGADRIARARNGDAVMILMYHGVRPGTERPDRGDRVSAAEFDWQIAFVRRHYDVRPLREWADGRAPEGGKPGAAITFDDGLRSVRSVALPIMEKHRCPATVFLCPGLMDQGKLPWFERLYGILSAAESPLRAGKSAGWLYESLGAGLKGMRPGAQDAELERLAASYRTPAIPALEDGALLDWEDASVMSAGGLIDFGAHTMTHPNLSLLSRAEQEEEIVGSRDAIRRRQGECALFAWPNGLKDDITRENLEIVRAAGFAASFTAIAGWARMRSERYLVPRTGLGPGMSRRHFAERISIRPGSPSPF